MTEALEDDLFGGDGGMPTHEQVLKVRDYLRRHNRIKVGFNPNDKRGVRPTWRELIARKFKISIATVNRVLLAADLGVPYSNTKYSDKKGFAKDYDGIPGEIKERGNEAPGKDKVSLTLKDLKLTSNKLIPTVMRLLENTSTELAVRENRVRMALNIIIAERMALQPNLLMLDMKSTAALVDSLTVASKLSGGSSIDIKIPTASELRAERANGHEMKVVEQVPKSALAQDLDAYRQKQAKGVKTS